MYRLQSAQGQSAAVGQTSHFLFDPIIGKRRRASPHFAQLVLRDLQFGRNPLQRGGQELADFAAHARAKLAPHFIGSAPHDDQRKLNLCVADDDSVPDVFASCRPRK